MKTPANLRARLAQAEETLRAIRNGEVDTVIGADNLDRQVFTLQGAEQAYRVLIESMNEGALTLTANKTILYANQRFAQMVRCPLEQIMGTSFRRFLSPTDRPKLRALLKRADIAGAKLQVLLTAGTGAPIPVLISIRPLAKHGAKSATVGMVVTDMTETRRTEELLRGLSHRLVQAQEAERGRVALELHDNITQLLCGVLVHFEALANKLSTRDAPARQEVIKLRAMLGYTAEEVERISRNLRPNVLDQLGLVPILRSDSAEFTKRTGVALTVTCVALTTRLPAEAELAFYRIYQEALKNVEKYAHAHHVTVDLTRVGKFAELEIKDDGLGFDPDQRPTKPTAKRGFGLLSMRERVEMVGGRLTVEATLGKGTTIRVQIPLRAGSTRRARPV